MDALESAGPRSVAELAALLGQAPDALYFHLRHLVRAGLVVESERRKTGRHVAVIYDLATRPLRISYAAPVRSADVASVIASALRLATRDFRRALPRDDIAKDGPGRELWGARVKGWVTPGQVERVNQLLHEISDIVRSGTPGLNAKPLSFSFVLAPAPPSPRATKAPEIEPARSSKRASARSARRAKKE